MPGLVPGIHALASGEDADGLERVWTSPAMTLLSVHEKRLNHRPMEKFSPPAAR
jgi:hypothetical protein